MAQAPASPKPAEPKKQDAADSGGERTSAGSNYGDWRPASPDQGEGSLPPESASGLAPVPGVVPSTAPSGIGSTPHK